MNECPACNYQTDPLKGICPECGADFTQISRKIFDKFKAWRRTNWSLKIIRGIYMAMILIMLLGWSMDAIFMIASWIFRSNSSFYAVLSWISMTSFSILDFGTRIGMAVACFLLPIASFRNGPISHRMIIALQILVLMRIVDYVGISFFGFYTNLYSKVPEITYVLVGISLQWIPWILIVLILMQISSAFDNLKLRKRFKLMMIFLLAQIPYQMLMALLQSSSTVQNMLGFSREEVIWYQMSDGMKIFIQTGSTLSMIAAFIYAVMGWIFIGQLCGLMGQALKINIPASPTPPNATAE